MTTSENYLRSVSALFRYYKNLGEKAMDQLSEAELHQQPHPESNNIATIVKHMSGNMLSRWTNFLTEDGEKSWRNREEEFMDSLAGAGEIKAAWEKGWRCLFDALDPLTDEDLNRIAYIRNEGHTVLEALNRQLGHYAYHVGQIVFLAKEIRGAEFRSLSIPKGQSESFNKDKFDQEKGRRHFV